MRTSALLLLTLAVVACERDETPKSAEVEPTAPTPVKEEPPEPVELEPALPEADVRAVFDTWLAAQNEGDFDKYAGVYADKFEGIKRVGARTYRYAHDGWLEDRQRMFRKKMNVTAADVKIQTSQTTGIVAFEQTWASGNYKDVGPKQLLVVKSADGLRIAREEMIQSNVAGAGDGQKRAYDPQAIALLLGKSVVLDVAPKRAWEKGPALLVSRGGTARKTLDLEASGFGGWVGREMELFGADGKACAARVSSVELLASIIPHFGTIDAWDGTGGGERAPDEVVAAEIWEMASDSLLGAGVVVAAQLDTDCKGALWARPKGGAAQPLAAQKLDGPTERNVVEAFTDLPGYHNVQSDYDSYGKRGAWHEADDGQVAVKKFGNWVTASAEAGHGCGDFEGGFWGIWTLGPQQTLVLQTHDEDPGLWRFSPSAAAQIGDTVYFTDGERVVSKVRDSWQLLWHVQALNFDCGC